MSYLAHYLCASTRSIKVDYAPVQNFIDDRSKAAKVAVLLTYLFSNTISKMTTSEGSLDSSLTVEVEQAVEHTVDKHRKLAGHNTILLVPSKVKFTVYKDGRIQFKDPSMAPYEMVELMSYYVWHDVNILNDTVHIGSSHSLSFYIKIADLGNISTEIPYNTILQEIL